MITVLPGFLGVRSDWNFLRHSFSFIDVNRDTSLPQTFDDWAPYLASTTSQSDIIIGYSLGGRIALHSLCTYPRHFKKAIIISAHTGLSTEAEKEERLTHDKIWAQRFLRDKWDTLLTAWNSQDVFSGHTIERIEEQYNREVLASNLTNLSLGAQEDLSIRLSTVETQVLFITGELDTKFTAIAHRASSSLPKAQHWICPNAGHRVPWENMPAFTAEIERFLAT